MLLRTKPTHAHRSIPQKRIAKKAPLPVHMWVTPCIRCTAMELRSGNMPIASSKKRPHSTSTHEKKHECVGWRVLVGCEGRQGRLVYRKCRYSQWGIISNSSCFWQLTATFQLWTGPISCLFLDGKIMCTVQPRLAGWWKVTAKAALTRDLELPASDFCIFFTSSIVKPWCFLKEVNFPGGGGVWWKNMVYFAFSQIQL